MKELEAKVQKLETLLTFLRRARRRIALMRAIRSLGLSVPIAAALLASWISILPLLNLSKTLLILPISLPFIWFSMALLRTRRLDLIAVEVDRSFDLKERVSTAYEIVSGRIRSGLGDLVIADALAHIEGVDLKAGFPLRFPKKPLLSLLLIPLALLIVHLTPYHMTGEVNPEEREAIAEVTESLSQLPAGRISSEEVVKSLRRTVKVMRDKRLDKSKALKRLAELESKVARQYKRASQADEALREIIQILKTSLPFTPKSIDRSSKIIEKVASDLENDRIPPEMLPQLERALKKLFERLGMLNDELTKSLDEVSRNPLSPESLRDLAKALREFESKADDLQILRMMLARIRKGELRIGMIGLEGERPKGRFASKEGLPGGEGGAEEALGGRSPDEGEFIPSGKAEETGAERFTPKGKGITSTPRGRGKFEMPSMGAEGGRKVERSAGGKYRVKLILPDSRVIAEAYKAAERYIASGRIPPLYREVVRRYFNLLSEGSR